MSNLIMTCKPDAYVYPPRATTCTEPGDHNWLADLGWIAQLKYNGTRTMIKYLPNGNIQLWNRHGERHRNYTTPDWLTEQLHQLREQLNLAPNEYHLLDGELLDLKHPAIKDTLVIWDLLIIAGNHQLGTTYKTRYQYLQPALNQAKPYLHQGHQIGNTTTETPNIIIPTCFNPDQWDNNWKLVHLVNKPYPHPLLEGLMFKDPYGKLEPGYIAKNNHAWQIRSRVTTKRHQF